MADGSARLHPVARYGGVLLAYLLAAYVGRLLVDPVGREAWWPPAGIAMGSVILFGEWVWPVVVLGSLLTGYEIGLAPFGNAAVAGTNAAEAVLASRVLRRVGFSPSLTSFRDVLAWVLIAAGGVTWLSAVVQSYVLPSLEPSFWLRLLANWASDALGVLLCGSAVITVGRRPPLPRAFRGAVDLAGLGLAAATLTTILAHAISTYKAVLALGAVSHLPFILWATLRFGSAGAGVSLLVSGLVLSALALGPLPELIWLERGHLAVIALWALLLAAAMNELKRQMQQTREREAYLRRVLDSLPFEAWTTNREGRYQYQNPPSRSLWGEMVGRLPADVPASDDVRRLFEANTRRALSGETVNAEVSYQVDGRLSTVLKIISPVIRDDDIIGTVGVNIDVTDIKAMETTIRTLLRQEQELRRQAETALAARTDFMRVASHELRTPLTIMAMALHALRGRVGTLDGAARSALDGLLKRCEVQAGRLTWLIQAMFYAAESAVILPRPDVAIDLSQTVAGICDDLTATAAGRGAPLRRHLDADCHLTTDPVLLKDVVFAVIDNAIKFGEGKPIDVRVSDIGGGLVRLQVEDQGIGMTEAQRDQVFERLFRGVPSEHYGGVGLGLWFSKQVVDRLGGEIRMQATPGSGCCVTIVLPKEPPQAIALAG